MKIYVELLNEATKVYRPVDAKEISANIFQIISPMQEEEEWAFPSDSIVRCEPRNLTNGEFLVAVEAISNPPVV